ncbi:MAG: anaerobic ribonucleoside-triphosphate reductase activating protein [Selenomonadaceae bacterium]|nr:anaerobic ribonucleoside-triphosphate reductase activating protein [Selenomonadaceae bacterium]
MKVKILDIRIAGVVPESIVDGEGIRYAIFMQGCLRNCEGCQNPATHPLDGGKIVDTAELINAVKRNPLLSGITLTGGEPLLQIPAAIELARATKNLGLNVWCYTGYKFEEIPSDAQELLKYVDVLVDGEFILALRDLELDFRGSSNQRIIDLNKLRNQNE